eukprot:3232423-Prymnesium_polylepis.1
MLYEPFTQKRPKSPFPSPDLHFLIERFLRRFCGGAVQLCVAGQVGCVRGEPCAKDPGSQEEEGGSGCWLGWLVRVGNHTSHSVHTCLPV